MTTFSELGLAAPLLKALEDEKYSTPTPIQAKAIPIVLNGSDLLGIAQTGTGKTAAFALPILHRLTTDPKLAPRGGCRVLVLSPTRELATQIAESFRTYGRHLSLSVGVVFGGVGHRPQIQALSRGVDVLVATPGRLLDHIDAKVARLAATEIFVLDEADQMLDLGFVKPIRRIVRELSARRQSLFFSATMPQEIAGLANDLLKDPVRIAVTPVATTVERVNQRVMLIEQSMKRALLTELLNKPDMQRTLVFTRTKRGADRVARHLESEGIKSTAIHGNKSQGQREQALDAFKDGKVRVLVATDIAARGIDIDAVSHVINFELPEVPEAYVHRIGRTARAGAAGSAISLCDGEERDQLRAIERLIRQTIPNEDRRRDPALAAATAAAKSHPANEDGDRRGRPDGRHGRSDRSRSPRREDATARREHSEWSPVVPPQQWGADAGAPRRGTSVRNVAHDGRGERPVARPGHRGANGGHNGEPQRRDDRPARVAADNGQQHREARPSGGAHEGRGFAGALRPSHHRPGEGRDRQPASRDSWRGGNGAR